MSRSLYTAVTGLRAHQTRMDVISNNIANVNTAGFKASRATFRDVFYQNISAGGSSNVTDAGLGGMNPYQIGYGTQVASIDTNHSNTGYSTTNIGSDCYINGSGYFAVASLQEPDNLTDMGQTYFTRVGMFQFDEAGWLVDVTGKLVCGIVVGEGGENDNESYSHEQLRPIHIDYEAMPEGVYPLNNLKIGTDGVVSGVGRDGVSYGFDEAGGLLALTGPDRVEDGFMAIALTNIPNPAALEMVGNSYYTTSGNTGEAEYYQTSTNNMGSIKTGGLEMSGTDLAQEFSDMIMTQRGFQANARIISVADSMLEELVNLKR